MIKLWVPRCHLGERTRMPGPYGKTSGEESKERHLELVTEEFYGHYQKHNEPKGEGKRDGKLDGASNGCQIQKPPRGQGKDQEYDCKENPESFHGPIISWF